MTAVDVSELMEDEEFASTITLRRPGAPTVANEGVTSYPYLPDRTLTAIVQTASTADLRSLPEGVDLTDIVSVWCDQQLKIGDQSGVASDVIVYQGRSYRVVKMDDRSDNGYWRVLAERFIP